MPQTMFDKIWESHEVSPGLIYIDLHMVHEVTSPQAFDGLRLAGRDVRRPDKTLATADHNTPTDGTMAARLIADQLSRVQVETLERNCEEFGIPVYSLGHDRQGIVHVIGPELGTTQPGMTIVCGDSHTSTHGAFGALAFGIGTSEVEHVLATQCLVQKRPKTMEVRVDGMLSDRCSAKDVILAIIGKIGTAGGTGYVIEYTGSAIRAFSMEGRMTLCNMSIEGGARAGMVAPDENTIAYIKGRPLAPKGELFEQAVQAWQQLKTDANAIYDLTVTMQADDIAPQVSWGTSPGMVTGIDQRVPDPRTITDENQRQATARALEYMGLIPNMPMTDIKIDTVFIGSCTNSRIEDLRLAASLAKGKHVAKTVHAMVVPGSGLVKQQAEREGRDRLFKEAGFEWREAGCSMCLAMNADVLQPGERCASTSNRNFEGRQGAGGRTHLVSPAMAVAAAVEGHFVDIRHWS